MNPKPPSTDPKSQRTPATSDKPSDKPSEQPTAGDDGGRPAVEEDIGTEGAGTEPPQTVDVERDVGTSRNAGREKGSP